MSLTSVQEDFLRILSASLGNAPSAELSASVDWAAVFRLADIQHLLPITFEAVRRMHVQRIPSELFYRAKSRTISQVGTHIALQTDSLSVYRSMVRQGLHPLVLKGAVCSGLYPDPRFRITSDLDLLVSEAEFDPIHDFLIARGFSTTCEAERLHSEYEVGYRSADGFLLIEVHRSLFDAQDQALNAPFSNLFDAPYLCEGIFTLPPDRQFLFLLFHAFKHFVFSGVGIRQVCDIGLWAQKYGAEIDWQWLFEACGQAGAEVFAASVFRIAREELGFDFCLLEMWENAAAETEPLLLDMLDGGVYGSESLTRLHSANTTLSAVRADRSGTHSNGFLRSVFPGRSYLQSHYPYAKRHPVLLPAAWCHRLLRYAREVGTNDRSSASGSVRLAKQRLQLLRDYKIIR